MAMTEGESGADDIVCNGFKDDSYIEAVILATKLAAPSSRWSENFDELALILKPPAPTRSGRASAVRVKLASEGAGPLAGIVRREVEVRPVRDRDPRAVPRAARARDGGLPAARALPPGQPAAGHPPRQGCRQTSSAHVYAELKLMRRGAGATYDVGGVARRRLRRAVAQLRLAMNYTLAEYASDVGLTRRSPKRLQRERGIDHPVIVSESGRAIAAHHSLARVQHARQLRRLDRIHSEASRIRGNSPADAEVPQPVTGPARRLSLDHRAAPRRVLPRRASKGAANRRCRCSTSAT